MTTNSISTAPPEPAETLSADSQEMLTKRGAFTPGPWRIAVPSTAIGQSEVETDGGEVIARCGYPFPFATDNKERDANARLIAAAPELFSACEIALRYLEAVCFNATSPAKRNNYANAASIVRTALAKVSP